jgi:hypothetical protein
VTESTDGQFGSSVKSPADPGYEEEVLSTPTQLVLQKDADGRPVAATVLSLTGTDGGGAVIHVPLQTEVRTPGYGVDRIIRAYDVLADDPGYARQQVAVQVANLLNVGIDGVVELDDRGWAQLVEPVAPLQIVNPDPLDLGGGSLDSGPVELTAEQVGPYLAAEILQTVVQIGGAVTVVGNGPSFGRDDTTIIFADPELRGYAELLVAALGGGVPRLDPEAEDSVGLTVILGRDVIDDASATTTRPQGATSTSGPRADDGAPVDPADPDLEPDLEPDPVLDPDTDSGGA